MIVYSVSTLSRTGCINIGYATETGVTEIGFDCSTWLERWPDMTVEVWVTAPGAASAYEANTHRRGDVIVWEVMQSDTQTPGAGRVEVIGYTADKRKLSATVSTRIEDSMLMAEGTEPPEAQQPWYTAAQEAKARAEALARHAPIIEDGMWMLWDPDKGAYVNSGVQAQAGSGLPDGAGPWMQLVTGADGVARWEPRLAYAETEEAVILPETTVEWQGEDTEANLTTPFAAKMVAGQEYTVVWNGDEYKCVAQAEDNGEGLVAVVLGDTESFPFSIFQLPEEFAAQIGVYAFITSAEPLTSATLSITGVVEKVKTIDDKYLHGETRTVILAETTLEYSSTDTDGYAAHALRTPLAARLNVGMVCDVMYNGKAYSLTAKSVAEGESLAVGLGNVGALVDGEEVTGEPFCIIQMPDALAESLGYLLVTDYDGTENVTLSITAKAAGGNASGGGVLYITAKAVPSGSDLDVIDQIQNPSHTYADVKAAVEAGKLCVLKIDFSQMGMFFYMYLVGEVPTGAELDAAYQFASPLPGVPFGVTVNEAGWTTAT